MKGFFLSLILIVSSVYAGDVKEFELSSADVITADVYKGEGKELFVYLPSERGLGKGYVSTAQQLAFFGKDVWALDLHSSYMVSKHRSSIDKFNVDHLLEIVDISKQYGFEKLVFIASGRGVQLALNIAHRWQLKNTDSNYIKGHIFHSPHLIYGKPDLGGNADYVDIASASNLPVYMIFPQYGTKYFRAEEIAKQLKKGGSSVFTHRLKGVKGGFHMRDEKDLEKEDIKARDNLADTYTMAASLISTIDTPKALRSAKNLKNTKSYKVTDPELKPYYGKQQIKLALNSIDNKTINIENYKGNVVLINFWASWCKPCVEEIPSLVRLKNKLKNKPFTILTINVGENSADIAEFKQKVKFDLPIALDLEGTAIKDWGVYAYPSNFILDQNGVIKYTYRGALEWDSDNVVNTINSLF